MKSVAWESFARREYEDALAISRDPDRFQREVEAALHDVASGLVMHAKVRRTRARRCILTSLPYSIIYVENDDEVRVWAFPHHSRKPGYWMNRLPKI